MRRGDVALLKALMCLLLEEEARAPGTVLDEDFIGLHTEGFDELRSISDDRAIEVSRELSHKEGIFTGISAGATLATALDVAAEADEGSVVRGLFAPSAGVWTGFMFLYALLGMVALCGCMYGLAQWTLDRPPWALLGIPAAAGLALLVRLAAHLGQKLGAEEMQELRAFANESLGVSLDPREAELSPSRTAQPSTRGAPRPGRAGSP